MTSNTILIALIFLISTGVLYEIYGSIKFWIDFKKESDDFKNDI